MTTAGSKEEKTESDAPSHADKVPGLTIHEIFSHPWVRWPSEAHEGVDGG